MEGRLISEIKCNQPVIHLQENFGYDPDLKNALACYPQMCTSGSSVVENI